MRKNVIDKIIEGKSLVYETKHGTIGEFYDDEMLFLEILDGADTRTRTGDLLITNQVL